MILSPIFSRSWIKHRLKCLIELPAYLILKKRKLVCKNLTEDLSKNFRIRSKLLKNQSGWQPITLDKKTSSIISIIDCSEFLTGYYRNTFCNPKNAAVFHANFNSSATVKFPAHAAVDPASISVASPSRQYKSTRDPLPPQLIYLRHVHSSLRTCCPSWH